MTLSKEPNTRLHTQHKVFFQNQAKRKPNSIQIIKEEDKINSVQRKNILNRKKKNQKYIYQPIEVRNKANDAHDSKPSIGGINDGIALIIGSTISCRNNKRSEKTGTDCNGERCIVTQFCPTNPITEPGLRSKWGNFFHLEEESELSEREE